MVIYLFSLDTTTVNLCICDPRNQMDLGALDADCTRFNQSPTARPPQRFMFPYVLILKLDGTISGSVIEFGI